ncbi:MAG: hypothetical protein WC984_04915 [Bacteroidales bacterium]
MRKRSFYYKGVWNDAISSIFIVFIAYIFVLYVSIFSTAFIAFTHNLSFPIDIYGVDFEKSVSGKDLFWSLPENPMVIFSFSPLILLSLALLSLVGTKFFKNKLLSLLCFWIAFLSVNRIFGDFIFGHIYNLWASNLVSDFLKITYPSLILKIIVIIINVFLAFLSVFIFTPTLKYFFDPHKDNLKDSIKTKILIPLISLIPLSLLWITPKFSINEFSLSLFSFLIGLYFSYKLSRINLHVETSAKKSRNFTLRLRIRISIILLFIIILFRILIHNGIYINSNVFTSSELDTLLFAVLVSTLIIFIIILVFVNTKIRLKEISKKKLYKLNSKGFDEQKLDPNELKGSKWDFYRKEE